MLHSMSTGNQSKARLERAPILAIKEMHKVFGGVTAVHGLSFDVYPREIVAIIGPNGAGKTTVFNLISRFLHSDGGCILFKAQNLNRLSSHRIASLGIARTFQLLQIFTNMLVIENVMVGCHLRGKGGILGSAVRLPNIRTEERNIFETAISKLAMVGLKEEAFKSPMSLPYGKQKLLELARALASKPDLLLLDEPAGGLASHEIDQLSQLICSIRDDGVTVLVVEHRMELVLGIADRVIVLNYGEKIAEGPPGEVQNNQEVVAAYLGAEF